MAYVIKYIGECITKNTNILPLYKDNIESGVNVFLVCEKEYEALIDIENIPKFYNVVEAKKSKSKLSVLFSDNPKIDCIYLAVQFNQVECEFYTEYNGVYSINPKEHSFAKKIDRIDYDELLIISDFGYRLVSGEVLEVAKRYGIAIRIISYNIKTGIEDKGSVIKEAISSDDKPIKAIVKDPNYCVITVFNISDEMGVSYRLFRAISNEEIVIDSIVLPATNQGRQDISFTVFKKDKAKVLDILKNIQNDIDFEKIYIDDEVAKISLIGARVQTKYGIASEVFRVLYENDINLKMINSAEIKISVFVDKQKSDLALKKLHDAFI